MSLRSLVCPHTALPLCWQPSHQLIFLTFLRYSGLPGCIRRSAAWDLSRTMHLTPSESILYILQFPARAYHTWVALKARAAALHPPSFFSLISSEASSKASLRASSTPKATPSAKTSRTVSTARAAEPSSSVEVFSATTTTPAYGYSVRNPSAAIFL